jgi:hypothetical protein
LYSRDPRVNPASGATRVTGLSPPSSRRIARERPSRIRNRWKERPATRLKFRSKAERDRAAYPAAAYRVLDPSGAAVSEAGIEGVRPGHRFVGVLHKETAGETNTALALAHVSGEETTAAVTFLLAPATTFRAEVALPARGHGAWFVDEEELFPELRNRDAHTKKGTLEVVGEAPVVAAILRTIRGLVSASLPLARQRTGLGD